MSAFFGTKLVYSSKNTTFTQNNSDSLVRNSLVLSFYKIKDYTKGKRKFYGYVDASILKSCIRNQ